MKKNNQEKRVTIRKKKQTNKRKPKSEINGSINNESLWTEGPNGPNNQDRKTFEKIRASDISVIDISFVNKKTELVHLEPADKKGRFTWEVYKCMEDFNDITNHYFEVILSSKNHYSSMLFKTDSISIMHKCFPRCEESMHSVFSEFQMMLGKKFKGLQMNENDFISKMEKFANIMTFHNVISA